MPDFLNPPDRINATNVPPYTGNYGFTTSAAMVSYMGQAWQDLMTDDLASATSEIENAILEAEDFLMQYLWHRYEPDNLVNVTWVSRRATELACYFLHHRRGHHPPEGLAGTAARIESELEKIANSDRLIVPGATPRSHPAPVVSNYAVDNRYLNNRARVVPSQTTGTHSGQRTLRRVPRTSFDE